MWQKEFREQWEVLQLRHKRQSWFKPMTLHYLQKVWEYFEGFFVSLLMMVT
jgi:hypothetical protein